MQELIDWSVGSSIDFESQVVSNKIFGRSMILLGKIVGGHVKIFHFLQFTERYTPTLFEKIEEFTTR